MNRYQRQIQVEKIGTTGQLAISRANVVMVGAGGLGCAVGPYLAGAGVGEIRIIDHDVVDISNLHRQTLFREKDIGQAKAKVMQSALAKINSEIKIDSCSQALHPNNVNELLRGASVVVDAADNIVVSYLLSDYCLVHRIPLVSASVVSTYGYVGVFCGTVDRPAPSLRTIIPPPPPSTLNCNQAGVTGPSVGIIGSLQAQEVIKTIVDNPASLFGKLMYVDLWNYQLTVTDFNRKKEPEYAATIISECQLHGTDLIIDVRSEIEASELPISLATHTIPLDQLPSKLKTIASEPQQRIVFVCKTGQRALCASQQLINQKLTEVATLVL